MEGLLRGYVSGILTKTDYNTLTQCETLEDMKLHLASTDYGDFLSNEPTPIHTTTIAEKCTQKMVKEFHHLRVQATEPLATFMDYITYQYMIDNVVLLITGTLHERDITELIEKFILLDYLMQWLHLVLQLMYLNFIILFLWIHLSQLIFKDVYQKKI